MAIVRQIVGDSYFNIPDEQLDQYAIPEDQTAQVLKDNNITLGVAGDPPADAELRDLEPTPLVAADLEGGLVNRLEALWGELPTPAAAASAIFLVLPQWRQLGHCQ